MTETEYKHELKDKLIKYRNTLFLPKDVTFGIEIEYTNISNELVSHLFREEYLFDNNFKNWINKREFDLSTYNDINEEMNGEINSPILTDNIDSWKQLRTSLNILNKNNGIITERCGGHVNIGGHIFENNTEYWRNFLLLWILYEKEIYKFSSGEFKKVRVRKDNTINRISPILKNNMSAIINNSKDFFAYLMDVTLYFFSKTYDIAGTSFLSPVFNENNRIEFRLPNGSLKEEIWQNYINFFVKFLLSCKKTLDVERVLYKIENNDHNAVELADYVFDEDIDKEYFLIQTLKTNKIYKKELPKHTKYE